MPELPEVETTRRGLAPHLEGRRIRAVVVRRSRLRWPVPARLDRRLRGATVRGLRRRGKWLLLEAGSGTLLLHLGMSGSLRLVPAATPPGPHDHLDLVLEDDGALRLHDPRRFGAVLWTRDDPLDHPRLAGLGPEPLESGFDGAWLHARARGRRIPVKALLMDGRVVAGVGNIYAAEALFRAGIHPARAAGRVSRRRYDALAGRLREVLRASIRAGGTSLRDFVDARGRPGWYRQRLQVYGRGGQPCPACGTVLRELRLAGRGTVYCPRCQR